MDFFLNAYPETCVAVFTVALFVAEKAQETTHRAGFEKRMCWNDGNA